MLAASAASAFPSVSTSAMCRADAGPARGDDGNRQPLRQPGVGVARVAVFRPVVVHRREQNLARSALVAPPAAQEKSSRSVSRRPPCVVTRHRPSACFRVDRNDDELAAVFRGDVADELRIAHGGAVDASPCRLRRRAAVRRPRPMLMPPPTVNGILMRSAMRVTSSANVRRPSCVALMSR